MISARGGPIRRRDGSSSTWRGSGVPGERGFPTERGKAARIMARLRDASALPQRAKVPALTQSPQRGQDHPSLICHFGASIAKGELCACRNSSTQEQRSGWSQTGVRLPQPAPWREKTGRRPMELHSHGATFEQTAARSIRVLTRPSGTHRASLFSTCSTV
jgi:hypothetical protein